MPGPLFPVPRARMPGRLRVLAIACEGEYSSISGLLPVRPNEYHISRRRRGATWHLRAWHSLPVHVGGPLPSSLRPPASTSHALVRVQDPPNDRTVRFE
jgi:hypothetical protein